MKASIYSIYFDNVSPAVVSAQRQCVEAFLPEGWVFYQILHKPEGDQFPHAHALEKCVEINEANLTVFLDIDCVPLSRKAFPYLEDKVMQDNGQGLAGIVQRANHLQNDKHLYVGPACMAFSKAYYKSIGSPSFIETARGDAGE